MAPIAIVPAIRIRMPPRLNFLTANRISKTRIRTSAVRPVATKKMSISMAKITIRKPNSHSHCRRVKDSTARNSNPKMQVTNSPL